MTNLNHITPFFIVGNLKASISFYIDKLGFKVQHISPEENPFFAIVGRDNVSIMLKEIAVDIKPIPNSKRNEWARWDAYVSTADPDVLFNEYCSNDISFKQPIRDDDNGLRGFEVTDADGYVLFFGRPNHTK